MEKIAPLSAFTGNITSFKLVSNDLCFGPCPQPDDIIEQHLSIHADGRVWLSCYCFGDGDKFKRTETKRLKLSEHQAGYILSKIQNFFETADPIQLLFVDDSGEWVIELCDSDNRKLKWRGSLTAGNKALVHISDVIRDSLDLPDLYCFDGDYRKDRIENIKINYHRLTKIRPGERPKGATWEYLTWDYNEHIYIDRATETIEHFQKIADECDITRVYHVGDGVASFLDDYDAETFLSEIVGNPDDVLDNPMEEKTYQVEIGFKYSEPRMIIGTYDKKSLPNDWPDFMNDLWEFMSFYGLGEILNPSVYGKVKRRRDDIAFCSVEFEEDGKSYYYIADEDDLEIDDYVVVPAGKDNHIAIAKVTKIEYFDSTEVPLPLEKTKHIIRKCTDDDFEEP